jgi:hypothetical protein
MNKHKISDYLFHAILVLLVTAIYAIIAEFLLSEGINQVFVGSLWKRLLLPVPPLVLLLGGAVYFVQHKRFSYSKHIEAVEKQDWFFALIPILPVARQLGD